jgi:hypothetical protein
VREVGGVKEKVLAAYRSGLREVMLPAANEKDLRELPDEVRAQVRFTFVHTLDEAIERVLLPASPLGFADDLPLFDGGDVGRQTADGGWRPASGVSESEERPLPPAARPADGPDATDGPR